MKSANASSPFLRGGNHKEAKLIGKPADFTNIFKFPKS
jgi:hypothetical protein